MGGRPWEIGDGRQDRRRETGERRHVIGEWRMETGDKRQVTRYRFFE